MLQVCFNKLIYVVRWAFCDAMLFWIDAFPCSRTKTQTVAA